MARIEIPRTGFDRRRSRVFLDTDVVRTELRLPATLVRDLAVEARATGATVSFIAGRRLRESYRMTPNEAA